MEQLNDRGGGVVNVSCSVRKEPQVSGFGTPVHVQRTASRVGAIPQ